MCDGHLNAKEQRRLMDDCDRWARRAEFAEAQADKFKRRWKAAEQKLEMLERYASVSDLNDGTEGDGSMGG